MRLSELDNITVTLGLCAYSSPKPRYHIWKLARLHKKHTKNPEVKRIMNKILKDVNPADSVIDVTNDYINKIGI